MTLSKPKDDIAGFLYKYEGCLILIIELPFL